MRMRVAYGSVQAYLLLDSSVVLDSQDCSTLLEHTGLATLASSLKVLVSDKCSESREIRRTLFLTRRASIWSVRTFVRDFSAFALWMYSINTRLFLKTLPFDFWYREW